MINDCYLKLIFLINGFCSYAFIPKHYKITNILKWGFLEKGNLLYYINIWFPDLLFNSSFVTMHSRQVFFPKSPLSLLFEHDTCPSAIHIHHSQITDLRFKWSKPMADTSQTERVSSEWDDLTGKVVLVTGASSGIGRSFCVDLANAGCKVIAAARRVDRLISLCDEINGKDLIDDVRAVAVELDVAAEGPVIEASVKKAWDAFGRIDCLINNAGVRGA